MAASFSGLLAALSKNVSCAETSSRQDDPLFVSQVDNTTASDKTPVNQRGSTKRVSKTRSNSKKIATSGNESEEDQEKDEDQIARGLSLTVDTLVKLKKAVAAKTSSEKSELIVSKIEHDDVSNDVKAKSKKTRKRRETKIATTTSITASTSPKIITCHRDVSLHQKQGIRNFSDGSGAQGDILFSLPGSSLSLVSKSNSCIASQGSDQASCVISMRALQDPENTTISYPDTASASSSVPTDPPAANSLLSNLKKDAVEKGVYPYDLSCAICGMLDKPLAQFLLHSKKGRKKCLSEAIERCLGVRVTRGIICSRCVTLLERCEEIIENLTPLCIKNCYRASGKVINSIKLDQDVYNQWCQLGNTQNLYTDNEIAAFLLRQYETLTQGARCSTCNVPVKLTRVVCSSCKAKAYAEQANTQFASTTQFAFTSSSNSRGASAASTQDEQTAERHALSSNHLHCVEETKRIKEEPPVYFERNADVLAASNHEIDDTEDMASNEDDRDDGEESKIEQMVDHDYVTLPTKSIDNLADKLAGQKALAPAVKLSVIPERLIDGKRFLILPKGVPLHSIMLVKTDVKMEEGKRVEESSVQGVYSKNSKVTGKKNKKTEVELHACEVCGASFLDVTAMQTHAKTHKLGGPYMCRFCHLSFDCAENQDKHEEIHKSLYICKKFVCHMCERTFKGEANLVSHVDAHARRERPEIELHACHVCGASFLDVTAMQTHAKTHKLGGPYMCRFCHLSFDCAENQDKHEEIHKRLYTCKKFVCHICERTFKGEANLMSHMDAHARRESRKYYSCSVCDKVYTRLQTLRDHMNIHEGEKRMYQCDQCGAAFKWRGNLTKHLTQHDEEKKPKICEICGKGFKRPKMLDLHIKRKHKGECPFFCHLCGKGLSSGIAYKCHLEMVHKQKDFAGEPVVCETCGEGFSSQTILSMHRRTHISNSPSECKVCGKTLCGVRNLRLHMKTHTGHPSVHIRDPDAKKRVCIRDPSVQKHDPNKSYSCQTCGKVLSSQSCLREHVFIHMAMRPRHTCVMCNKSFAHKGTLRQHMLLGHNPSCKPHKCTVCQAAYRTRFGLTLHKKRLGHGVVRSRRDSKPKPIPETAASVVTDPTPPTDDDVCEDSSLL